MTLDTNFKNKVRLRSCYAKYNVSIIYLSIIKCHLSFLIYFSINKFRSTRYTATILTTIGEINALFS